MAMTACYFIDVDDVRADDAIVYAAPMSHGAGIYNFPFLARAARHVVPASGGFDPAELVALSRSIGRLSPVRRADHGQAPGRSHRGQRRAQRRLQDHRLRRRADVRGRHARRALAVMGPRFVQIYGQGESPMTITALAREHLADAAHPRYAERLASVGVAHSLVEVRVAGADGAAAARGRDRRGAGARRQRDGRLLAQPRGQRRDAARRLAVDRRRRQRWTTTAS